MNTDQTREERLRRERRASRARTRERRRARRRRAVATLAIAVALGALLAATVLDKVLGSGEGTSGRTATHERGRTAGASHGARAGGGGHSAAAGGLSASDGGLSAGTGRNARLASGPSTPSNSYPPPSATSEAIESPEIRRLIAFGKPIYCAAPRGDEVALTFDDGPGQYTWLAIPKLRKHDIKATFFIVGRNIPLRPQALREERALGALGDHTFTHPLLTSLSPGEAEAQIVRTQHAVESTSGGPVFLFRPPYGGRDAKIDAIAKAHNLLEILWTVDSRDSLGANYAEIERNVIDGLHPGAIILMHENHGQTIRAMLGIFAALQRKHLRTVSVPRLLADDPPSQAQVRSGGAGCGSSFHAGLGGG